jgi:hypothetical protein
MNMVLNREGHLTLEVETQLFSGQVMKKMLWKGPRAEVPSVGGSSFLASAYTAMLEFRLSFGFFYESLNLDFYKNYLNFYMSALY